MSEAYTPETVRRMRQLAPNHNDHEIGKIFNWPPSMVQSVARRHEIRVMAVPPRVITDEAAPVHWDLSERKLRRGNQVGILPYVQALAFHALAAIPRGQWIAVRQIRNSTNSAVDKSTIASLREKLARFSIVIEARNQLGYRLRFDPLNLGEAAE